MAKVPRLELKPGPAPNHHGAGRDHPGTSAPRTRPLTEEALSCRERVAGKGSQLQAVGAAPSLLSLRAALEKKKNQGRQLGTEPQEQQLSSRDKALGGSRSAKQTLWGHKVQSHFQRAARWFLRPLCFLEVLSPLIS